jgi:hypothetical protein
VILDELTVDQTDFESRTGWISKPEGLCKGDLCVPAAGVAGTDGRLDVMILSQSLGMPLVHDPDSGSYALGPESLGRSLNTAVAPEVALPNAHDGNTFSLSSLHGRKVLLVAWASW